MKMSRITRRILAAFVGLLAVIFLAVWTLFGEARFSKFAKQHLGRGVPLSGANSPRPDSYDPDAEVYYAFLIGALIVAAGLLAAVLVIEPRATFRKRAWLYAVFLLIVLPASWYNYNQMDTVLAPSYQVGLNLIVIFLTASIAI
jgi:hypothetical protein